VSRKASGEAEKRDEEKQKKNKKKLKQTQNSIHQNIIQHLRHKLQQFAIQIRIVKKKRKR
jgi:hypothetical protein